MDQCPISPRRFPGNMVCASTSPGGTAPVSGTSTTGPGAGALGAGVLELVDERLDVVETAVRLAGDEEGRRPADAARRAARAVLLDARGGALEVRFEPGHVEPELLRVADEVLVGQRAALRAEERVVHLPEPALRRRGLRRLRGAQRVRVLRRDREVSEDEADAALHPRADALERRDRVAAVRALEVAVLDEVDGSLA